MRTTGEMSGPLRAECFGIGALWDVSANKLQADTAATKRVRDIATKYEKTFPPKSLTQ